MTRRTRRKKRKARRKSGTGFEKERHNRTHANRTQQVRGRNQQHRRSTSDDGRYRLSNSLKFNKFRCDVIARFVRFVFVGDFVVEFIGGGRYGTVEHFVLVMQLHVSVPSGVLGESFEAELAFVRCFATVYVVMLSVVEFVEETFAANLAT